MRRLSSTVLSSTSSCLVFRRTTSAVAAVSPSSFSSHHDDDGRSSALQIPLAHQPPPLLLLLQRSTPHQRRNLSAFAPSPSLLEKKTVKVPGMGDSITEGTIVEWVVSVGQAVKEDDVVALVETDKVTVDIKAEMDGVLTQQFGAIDDTVEVGADLYELDTEAEATVDGIPTSPPATPSDESTVFSSGLAEKVTTALDPAPGVPNIVNADRVPSQQQRVPSIQFLGKDGWERRRLLGLDDDDGHQAAAAAEPIPPMYGRPLFSDLEMEALIMGGANISPNVTKLSSGATFGK